MKRRYTLDAKINALNQLDCLDGDLALASRQLNIPAKTLEKWRAKELDLRRDYRERSNRRLDRLTFELRLKALDRCAHLLDQMNQKTLEKASLNQLNSAFNTLLNQALRLKEVTEEIEDQQKTIRFEHLYDGQTQEAPPWARTGDEEPRPLQSRGLRTPLGENGTGADGHPDRGHHPGQTLLVDHPDLPDGRSSLARLERAVKNLKGSKISQSQRRIDLPNGGMIAVRSGHHPDNLRGEGLDFAVLDEAAFIDPRLWIEIIRPMLATTLGQALILSTPNGRNWFWQLHQLGLDPAQKDWAAFRFHSADNPLISHAELENIRSLSPEQVWKTEYQAHFSDDSGQVFRGIADAVAADHFNAPQPGHTYVAGIDWGRNNDYTAIAVIDVTSGVMIALDRFNQVGWELQRNRLKNLIQHWRPSIVWAEANSIGEPNIEALMGEGLPIRPFFTSAKTKSPAHRIPGSRH